MKLYKFLLIKNDVIEKTMELVWDGNYHKNSIYVLRKDFMNINIGFVRFCYPNDGSYQWAYAIIDGEDIVKIREYKWGTTADKIGNNHQAKDKPYVNLNRVIDERNTEQLVKTLKIFKKDEMELDIEELKQYRYIKTGGWLNNAGKGVGYLHRYLIGIYSSKSKVHHKGHTFDNRKDYLKKVTIGQHRIIHNYWEPVLPCDNIKLVKIDKEKMIRSEVEPVEVFYRAQRIVLGDCYSRDLECGICNKDCTQCNGVLLIEEKEVLRELINRITGGDYRRLIRKEVYSKIK